MAILDDLDKDNKKIVFIELNYLDVFLNPKTTYFSDYYIDLPTGLVDGGELMPVESRLSKIPYFARTVDFINGDIVKGSYTITIENTDDEYTTLFKENYFRNKIVNFYITIEGYSPFDKLQLAQGSIKEVEIKEKEIKVKIDEVSLYQTKSNITKDPELDGEYQPYLQGHINNYELNKYNINRTPTESGQQVDIEIDASSFVTFENYIWFKDEDNARKARRMLSKGDIISLANDPNRGYKVSDLFPRDFNDESFNLRIEVEQNVFSSSLTDSKIYVLLKEEKNNDFNDEFLISTNVTIDNINDNRYKYEYTWLGTGGGQGTSIEIQDNWTFLEEGDIVFFAKLSNGNTTIDDSFWFNEEMVVDSYDPDTKIVTVKDYCPIAFARSPMDNYALVINKLSRVDINKRIPFKRSRNLVEIDFLNVDGADFATATQQYAKIKYNNIEFVADTLGSAENGTEILFQRIEIDYDTSGGGRTAIYTSFSHSLVTNEYGVNKDRWTIGFVENNLTADGIVALLDAYTAGIPVTPLNFTYSRVGINRQVKESKKIDAEGNFWQFPSVIKGGGYTKSYLKFNIEDFDNGDFGNVPRTFAIWFNVDGDTIAPDIGINDGYGIDILSTDTRSQVMDKMKFEINVQALLLDNWPLLCAESATDKLVLKFSKYNKYPLNFSKQDIPFISRVYHEYQDFYDMELVANPNIYNSYNSYLKINKDLLNIAVKEYISPDHVSFKLATNLYVGVRNELVKNKSYIAGQGFAGDYSNLKHIIAFDLELKDDVYGITDSDVKSTAIIYNETTPDETYFTNVIKKQDDFLYVNHSLDSYSQYTGEIQIKFYNPIEIEDISMNYKDKSNLKDVFIDLFSYYNITKYNTADLDLLDTDHVNFKTNLIITSDDDFYEILKQYTESFNLFTYIDREGDIRIKFWNVFDSTTPIEIDFNSVISISQDIQDMAYSKYILNIIRDLALGSSTAKTMTDAFTTALATLTDWNSPKELDSNIMRDFIDETFDGRTYGDLLSAKYLSKIEEIEIIGSLDLITKELGDLINITNYDKVDSSSKFVINNIETNGDHVKLNALRVIENPILQIPIVDENENNITDENGNLTVA